MKVIMLIRIALLILYVLIIGGLIAISLESEDEEEEV